MCSVKTRPKPGLASMRSRSAAGIRVAAGWYSNRTAEVVELTSKEAYPTHGDFAETAPDGSSGTMACVALVRVFRADPSFPEWVSGGAGCGLGAIGAGCVAAT